MRTEICKSCCPSGGAIFEPMVPVYDDDFNVLRYTKQCRNCGAFKDYRKSPAQVIARRAERNRCAEALLESLLAEESKAPSIRHPSE